jgi:hypothetical protein
MQPEDVQQLFCEEDLKLLSKAKGQKSCYYIYQDCIELVQGFFGVREICETGKYKSRSNNGREVKMERRRKTMATRPASLDEAAEPGKENEAPIDSDDRFHDAMKAFVDSNLKEANSLAKGSFAVFKIYKDLAFFFDDVNSLWPIACEKSSSTKVDLITIFHGLAENVRVHREEVQQDGLRALVNPPQPASDTASAESCTSEETVAEVPAVTANAESSDGQRVAAPPNDPHPGVLPERGAAYMPAS